MSNLINKKSYQLPAYDLRLSQCDFFFFSGTYALTAIPFQNAIPCQFGCMPFVCTEASLAE